VRFAPRAVCSSAVLGSLGSLDGALRFLGAMLSRTAPEHPWRCAGASPRPGGTLLSAFRPARSAGKLARAAAGTPAAVSGGAKDPTVGNAAMSVVTARSPSPKVRASLKWQGGAGSLARTRSLRSAVPPPLPQHAPSRFARSLRPRAAAGGGKQKGGGTQKGGADA